MTGEAIRDLLILKPRNVNDATTFASKAVAAGVAERTVRIAERQGPDGEDGASSTARS